MCNVYIQLVLVGAMDRIVYRDALVYLAMCLPHVIAPMEHVTVCQAILGLHVKGVNIIFVVVVVLAIIQGLSNLSSSFQYNIECPKGSYGQDCMEVCRCQNGASCDAITGECNCAAGWTGETCDTSS